MNLFCFLEHTLRACPDKIAIKHEDQAVTYRELNRISAQVASFLNAKDIPNARIGVLAHNSIPQCEVILAAMRANYPCCCLNWRLTEQDIAARLQQAKINYLIYDDHTASLVQDVQKLFPQIQCEHIDFLITSDPPASEFPIVHAFSQDVALMYFTSGTTGTPKGVMLTHGGLTAYILSYTYASGWGPDVVYQTAAPMFHISGFSALICILTGGTVILHDKFCCEAFLQSIERNRPNRLSLNPTTLQRILHAPSLRQFNLSSVKKLVYGGSPISLQLAQLAIATLSCSLEQGYGMTETGTIFLLSHEDHLSPFTDARKNRLLSAGKPLMGVDVRIIDNKGTACSPFTIGEIIVYTPSLFKGYCNNHAETCAKIRNGWYYTGDMGYLDDEGYLYVVDRKDDMIISGGENIYPKEIERCILEMGPKIAQVAVTGITDPEWGGLVAAFVVKADGSNITENDIYTWCRQKLAHYKCPRRIFFLQELPLNASGKVQKSKLKHYTGI